MPSRADLAREYGVALETLQRAMRELLRRGLLIAYPRRGIQVAPGVGEVHAVVAPIPPAPLITAVANGQAQLAQLAQRRVQVLIATSYAGSLPQSLPYDDWMPSLCRGNEAEAQRHGLHLDFHFLVFSRGDTSGLQELPAILLAPCDARICVDLHSHHEFKQAMTPHFRDSVPVVWVGGDYLPESIPQIFPDQRQAGYIAARTLIDAGYQRLLLLPIFQADWAMDRMRGAQDAARQAAVPCEQWPPASDAFPHQLWGEEQRIGADQVNAWIEWQNQQADIFGVGIIAANDVIAEGVIAALTRRGIRLGEEVGVIGFDDYVPSRALGLSTLRPPLEDMGRAAIRTLVDYMANPDPAKVPRMSLRHEVFGRASTRGYIAQLVGSALERNAP